MRGVFMSKKLFYYLPILIISIFMFIPNVKAVNYGKCITRYGSMSYVGVSNDAADVRWGLGGKQLVGNIDYYKGNNDSNYSRVKWGSDPVNFHFGVQTNEDYTVEKIYYRVGSCTGEITGFPKGKKRVNFRVTISKGYVKDFTAWGTMTRKSASGKISRLGIRKETKPVKRSLKSGEEPLQVEEDSAGQTVGKKMECTSLKEFLDKYWSWVIILAPILTIVLISIDLVTVIISSDVDRLKKVGSNSVKRMTALVILLFLPYLVEIVFGWFGLEFCL